MHFLRGTLHEIRFTRYALVLLAVVLSACSGDGMFNVNLAETLPDNGTEISDGGNFDPTASGDINPCVKNDDGDCEDNTDDADTVSLDIDSIDFGLGEAGFIECETISMPAGSNYSAEIDATGNSEEFAFMTGADTYSAERTEGAGTVSVCYLRSSLGVHAGRLELVLDADGDSAPYAYVITLNGETLDTFFTIESPLDGQIIDGREGANEGRDDDEGDYLVTARGSINMELSGVLENGLATPVIIESAGVKYKADLDANGAFTATVGVPQTPGRYNVEFSAATNENSAITRTVEIVVADSPELEISVKDASGLDITAGIPSDVQYLVAGFKVRNLNLSGSSAEKMPVQLSNIMLNGVSLGMDHSIWYSAANSWCNPNSLYPGAVGSEDYPGFDATVTYCFPLSDITALQTGQNVITATATNELGSDDDEFTLILDYDKPVLAITAPRENQLYSAGTTSFTVTGTVKNYAPLESNESAPDVKSGDAGSYCLSSTSGGDSSCPASALTLWINANPEAQPVYVYPEITGEYAGKSRTEIFTDLSAKDPERCRNEATTTTDAITGEEITTTETLCNIPEAKFSFAVTLPDTNLNAPINLFKNVIEIRAESLASTGAHRTIATRSFAVGETNGHTFKADSSGKNGIVKLSQTGVMTTGSLGGLNDTTGLVTRAPLMLNISEGSLKDPNLIRVIQKILNDEVPFGNLANGWNAWPANDDGDIDPEADFQRQYRQDTGKEYGDFWQDLPDAYQEKFIYQALHSTNMAMKLWARTRYAGYGVIKGWWEADEAFLNFFEREGNPEDPDKGYNVALDRCDQPITTTFTPVGDLYRIFEPMNYDPEMIPFLPEWPDIAAGDYKFDDFVAGRWIVQSAEFEEGTGNTGLISVDACLVPTNANVDNCEDDIPESDDLLPAFWGHFVAYNLVEGGLLGPSIAIPGLGVFEIDDPTMPLIWSIGKIRMKLTKAITIEKVLVDGKWTNKLSIDKDGITPANLDESAIKIVTVYDDLVTGETLHDESEMAKNSIQVYPYARCEGYYRDRMADGTYDNTGNDRKMPFGCDEDDPEWNYPFILERNSEMGRDLYNTVFGQGESYYILGVVWQGVMETFAKQIRCMDEEIVNPLLNSAAFPYPAWIPEAATMDTNFALDVDNEEIAVVSADEASSPLAEMQLNVTQADININHPDDKTSVSALSVRLPFTMSAGDVTNSWLSMATPVQLPGIFTGSSATTTAIDYANVSGHLVRANSDGSLDGYPLFAGDPEDDMFAGISLGVEEIVNAATYLIFKKGPFGLLDDFGVSELEVNDNWSIGVDKVVLGRFDICGDLAGVLNTDLPADLLFANIKSEFNYPAMHLDVELDKNHPPVLAMEPITTDGMENSKLATNIKIGITNVQISAKDLETTDVENKFCVGDEVVKVRLDGVISLKAVYHEDEKQLNVFLDPYVDQNVHLSVVPGHGGASYDDVNVIYSLATEIIPQVFNMVSKTFNPDFISTEGEEVSPSITVKFKADADGSISIHDLGDLEVTVNMEEVPNGSCVEDGVAPPEYGSAMTCGDLSMAPFTAKPLTPRIAALSLGGEEDSTGSGQDTRAPSMPVMVGEIMLANTGCDESGIRSPLMEEDALRSALCDLGISDILLKPAIEFDNDNGYIHVSAEWMIELYDWLIEEMDGK